jgi:hypothetical protein
LIGRIWIPFRTLPLSVTFLPAKKWLLMDKSSSVGVTNLQNSLCHGIKEGFDTFVVDVVCK